MTAKSGLRPWWLTMRLNGEVVGDWCKPVPNSPDSVICSYCRTLVKVYGFTAIKRHAFCQKHAKAKSKISSVVRPTKGSVVRHLEPRRWSDFKNSPFPWCKQIVKLKRVLCMYCVRVLACRDMYDLKKHALSKKHRCRAKLIEDASPNFKNDLLDNKMPIASLLKKIGVLEKQISLSNTDEEFTAGCFRHSVISDKQVLKAVKIHQDQAFNQQVTLSGGMSPTSFNSSVNCYVPLSPVSISENDQFKNRKLYGKGNGLTEVFMCFYCVQEFSSRAALHAHQDACDSKIGQMPPLSRVTPLPVFAPSEQHDLRQYIDTDRDAFLSSLGLTPKETAMKMTTEVCRKEFDSVDLSEDEQPQTNLPRTTKCLLSHLSHDESKPGSPLKRRLSVSSQRIDSNSSGACDRSNGEPVKVVSKLTGADSLYNIDLTSPLGLLVRKLIKGNPALHVLSDVESHCLTSIQTKVFCKDLRQRNIRFPITFKEHLLKCSKHCHLYKFTRRQRQEFMAYVHSGLNKSSRVLLKLVKPCRVRIARLNKAELRRWMLGHKSVKVVVRPLTLGEIDLWTNPRAGFRQAAAAAVIPDEKAADLFPCGLKLNSPEAADVLGLQTTCRLSQRRSRPRLSIANFVSEENMAEMVTSRKVVLKSLLSDAGITEFENLPLVSPSLNSATKFSNSLERRGPLPRNKCLPDITNLEVDLIKSPSGTLTCSPYQTDSNAMKSDHLTRFPISLHSSQQRHLSNGLCKVDQLVKSVPKTFQLDPMKKDIRTRHGPVRSGVYNVHVRTTKEGETIRPAKVNLFKKLQSLGNPLRDHNKMNLSGYALVKPAHSHALTRRCDDRSRRSLLMSTAKACNNNDLFPLCKNVFKNMWKSPS